MIRICVVCLGNICRSPMAEVVIRARLADAGVAAVVDSAGTGAWHVGGPADPRAAAALRRRGYEAGDHVARQLSRRDIAERDLVLALDSWNLHDIERLAGGPKAGRIRLLSSYAPGVVPRDVPDPYSGDDGDFDQALDLIERAAEGLANDLTRAGTSAPPRP